MAERVMAGDDTETLAARSDDTETAPAAPPGATGLNGAQAGDWRASLPEPLRAEKSLGTFKDVPALAQAYVEATHKLGATLREKPAPKPEEPAKPAEPVDPATVVPADPSGYVPSTMEGLDPERWAQWAMQAHKHGLTPRQLEAFAVAEAEERRTLADRQAQALAEGREALKKQWGEPTYNANVTYTTRALQQAAHEAGVSTEEMDALFKLHDFGNHPTAIKLFAPMGAALREHGFIDGRIEGQPGVKEAERQVAEIRAKGRQHPANDPDHPQYAQARAQLDELFKIIHGGR